MRRVVRRSRRRLLLECSAVGVRRGAGAGVGDQRVVDERVAGLVRAGEPDGVRVGRVDGRRAGSSRKSPWAGSSSPGSMPSPWVSWLVADASAAIDLYTVPLNLAAGVVVLFQARSWSPAKPGVELASTYRSYSLVAAPLSTSTLFASVARNELPSTEMPSRRLPQAVLLT